MSKGLRPDFQVLNGVGIRCNTVYCMISDTIVLFLNICYINFQNIQRWEVHVTERTR
jgi:hypothetical protein